MTARATLSVILIAKNEEAHILECLKSVAFADEIIVIDSGSSDDTVALARQAGAIVTVTPDWPGFGIQKNRALAQATCDWVLSLDCDERITPELATEITAILTLPGASDAYAIPRLSEFCGRFIRHSGWWPDPVIRLFRRGAARFTDAAVHEKVTVTGKIGQCRANMLHFPYDGLSDWIDKMNRYSSAAAQIKYDAGRTSSAWGALMRGCWTFFRAYVLRRGFLDGWQGVVLAAGSGAGNFFRYAKLIALKENKKREDC